MVDEVAGVTEQESPTGMPTDRPVQNVMGEFSRKFGGLEQKVDIILNHMAEELAAKQRPTPPVGAKGAHGALSDDELWELAKAGNKAAFDAHQERKARSVYQEERGRENHQALVGGQLGILQGKYPVLNDANHPLTQVRNAAYTLLTRRGYPANEATFLEATKTAIADRPDLVAELYTQGARAREGARRVSAGNTGVTGTTYRQDEPSANGSKMRVTPAEAALAQRMSIKDPAGAKERFMRRRAAGLSNLGAVGGLINEEEF